MKKKIFALAVIAICLSILASASMAYYVSEGTAHNVISSSGVDIVIDDFRYTNVTDDSGKAVSDHAAAECDFTFIKTADFTENGDGLEVNKTSIDNFFYRLKWILRALVKVLSDLGNLPSLLEELGI
jgi:hypothetical protein